MTEMGSGEDSKVLFIDVSRAHFPSPARRTIYIDLPEERRVEGYCGVLRKSMYGTRGAAANFASLVMQVLGQLEFDIGAYNPCLAKHRKRDILLFYHGDDFVVKGSSSDLKWLAADLGKELIVKLRGVPGSIVLLNRITTYGRGDDDKAFTCCERCRHVGLEGRSQGEGRIYSRGEAHRGGDHRRSRVAKQAVPDLQVRLHEDQLLGFGSARAALQRKGIGDTRVETHFSLVGHGEAHWEVSPPMPEDCSAHDHAD